MSELFDYGKLQEWANSQEPVFIVGPERSGTSMMFRSVVSHPSFCGFANATVETFCFIRPNKLLEAASPDNYEMRVYLGSQQSAFNEAVKPFRQIGRVCNQIGIPSNYLGSQRKLVWDRRGYRDLLRAFFYFSWKNLGEKRIAEKTPAHVRCLHEIFETFPRAKVLICLRDPLEVIASHRKRLAREIELGKDKADPSLDWLKKSVDGFMRYFENIDKTIKVAMRQFPSAIMLVPYLRVTRSPDFLRDVFGFLGEDVDRLSVMGSVPDTDKALNWDPLLTSLPKENTIDYACWLSDGEIESVMSYGQLGYWRE